MPANLKAQPSLAILDYGMGNLRSVSRAFEKVGAKVSILTEVQDDKDWDALILPGVGALGDCVQGLKENGFDLWIRKWVSEDKPFFGICLGLQALFDFSEEGNVNGLGIFKGRVARFAFPKNSELKIPHMGWNNVRFRDKEGSPMLDGLLQDDQFYFVHSYYVVPEDPELVWGLTEYGDYFVSAIRRSNCFATQFHPEKSQGKGLQIYANFLNHIVSLK